MASSRVIRTAQARDRAPDDAHRRSPYDTVIAQVHPDSGIKEGARAEVSTGSGKVRVTVTHDDTLRPGVIDLPFVEGTDSLRLLDSEAYDPWTGSPTFDGIAAELHVISE